MKSKLIDYVLGTAILVVVLFAFNRAASPAPSFSGATFKPTFSSAGTTNTTSTVNTTSTLVLAAGWSNIAVISNTATATISCYLDNQTAASSSVATNSGIIINSNALPGNIVSFGPLGQIPYVGGINCLASFKTVVGLVKN